MLLFLSIAHLISQAHYSWGRLQRAPTSKEHLSLAFRLRLGERWSWMVLDVSVVGRNRNHWKSIRHHLDQGRVYMAHSRSASFHDHDVYRDWCISNESRRTVAKRYSSNTRGPTSRHRTLQADGKIRSMGNTVIQECGTVEIIRLMSFSSEIPRSSHLIF